MFGRKGPGMNPGNEPPGGHKVKFGRELFVVAGLLVLVGAMFLIAPKTSTRIICYALGAGAAIWGIIRIVSYFAAEKGGELVSSYGFVQGTALLAVGVIIIIKPSFLTDILTIVFGIIMLVDGILKIQYAMDLGRAKRGNWIWVLAVGILVVIVSIIILINPFKDNLAWVLMRILGISLIADGLLDIAVINYVGYHARRFDGEPIDGEINHEENIPPFNF